MRSYSYDVTAAEVDESRKPTVRVAFDEALEKAGAREDDMRELLDNGVLAALVWLDEVLADSGLSFMRVLRGVPEGPHRIDVNL